MRKLALALLLLLFATSSEAEPSPAGAAEINHLLEIVETSPCTFVRNGTPYPAEDARAHMELKYGHVRGRVDTAEDFVELAGSQSSMTGRPYLTKCPGEPQRRSRDWLLERLRAFRDGAADRH